jgi:hypothetical protein
MPNDDRPLKYSFTNNLVENMAEDWLAGNIQEYFWERKRVGTQPASDASHWNDCAHLMSFNKDEAVKLGFIACKCTEETLEKQGR